MTPLAAFKVGFLARCVEDGLNTQQIQQAVKTACEKQALLTDVLSALKGVGSTAAAGAGQVSNAVLGYGLPVAAVAPSILGGTLGYGLARATDIDDTDINEVKDEELKSEYQRQTDHLMRTRAARDYKKSRAATGRMFPR